MKPFFVHYHKQGKPTGRDKHLPKGFTLFVEEDGPRTLKVRGTWCSPKDHFCKKTGREMAMNANMEIINKRDLPLLAGSMQYACYSTEEAPRGYEELYMYLLKYVV